MKKLLLAFIALTLFACSSEDTAPVDPNNGNPENPNPENPNPENPNPENPAPETDCYYNDYIVLKTQAEVDAFAANNYCTVGGLTIGGSSTLEGSDITSLAGLASIKKVNMLTISRNPNLLSLQGLHNLKSAGQLLIDTNNSLVSLSGLDSFKTVGTLKILNNTSLTTTAGMGQIETVDIFHIGNNAALINLDGLETITKITTILGIRYCPSLNSVAGLSGLEDVVYLAITDSPFLTSLASLANLKTINGITFNYTGVSSLNGLQNITSQLQSITLESNQNLNDFCAVSDLIYPEITLSIKSNLYNPTVQDIIAGNCSQ